MAHEYDNLAIPLFTAALAQGVAGELLECLFAGGSATVDRTGKVVMITEDILKQMGAG